MSTDVRALLWEVKHFRVLALYVRSCLLAGGASNCAAVPAAAAVPRPGKGTGSGAPSLTSARDLMIPSLETGTIKVAFSRTYL